MGVGRAMLLTIGDLIEEFVIEPLAGLRRGRSSEVRSVRVRGGSAANVAAIVCERGGSARFVGQVGADAVGESLVADLAQRGVDVRVETHGATGTVLNLLLEGYRTTLVDRGASSRLERIDPGVLEGVTHLFLPARSMTVDPLAGVAEQVLAAVAERRILVTMTGLAADEVADYGAAEFLEFVATVGPDSIISTARDHARLGLGPEQPVAGSACTVVLGPDSTTIMTSSDVQHRQPMVPAVVVDRTGAEDGFVAGYVMSRRTGAAAPAAVDAAHRVASLVMARLGPTTRGNPAVI